MSYVQSLYHAVIRTKSNKLTLPLNHSDKLYRYIWGAIKNRKCVLYRVNGMEDHIHILFSLHPSIALADFMRDLKVETSKMLKHTVGFEKFTGWSEGYAALGCSRKDKNIVINYIKNQREHHTNISLREEYIRFLKEAGLELDERDWDR